MLIRILYKSGGYQYVDMPHWMLELPDIRIPEPQTPLVSGEYAKRAPRNEPIPCRLFLRRETIKGEIIFVEDGFDERQIRY
jgi:hypothetical protein